MTLEEIIRNRRSVRTYDAMRPVGAKDIAALRAAVEDSHSPFGGNIAVELKEFNGDKNDVPATYGTVKGAKLFFLMGHDGTKESQLSLGFRMQQVALKAAEMGLGTCWMSGTFNGSGFAKAAAFPTDTPLKLVKPVGYAAPKKRLSEVITRIALRSERRKPIAYLFYDGDFETPVDRHSKFRKPLEMMRLAPSSNNSQPWRAFVADNAVFFYYIKKSKVSLIDLGIGLAHFYLAAKECGIEGEFSITRNAPAPEDWIPVVKFRAV